MLCEDMKESIFESASKLTSVVDCGLFNEVFVISFGKPRYAKAVR